MVQLYRLLAYAGVMAIFGSLLVGFRHDPGAPLSNLWFDLGLYACFVAPHLFMTRAVWKRRITGNPAGTPRERRVFVLVATLTWFAVIALHRPIPGPALHLPQVVTFAATLVFLFSFMLFFHGITMPMLDGLFGVPGAVQAYSHGPETPLFTDGPYAEVRHPMYRAALLAGLSSLFIHPHAGQLLWVLLVGGTFVAFIPVEEAQMAAARGEDYGRYREKTRWRILRGIW